MLFALPFPAIDPVLVQLGPFAVRWYALAYIAGILLGWWYMRALVRDGRLWATAQPRPSLADVDDVVLWATLGIVLGGRLGYVMFYNPLHFLQNPAEILVLWEGGMSFHGGFLGVVAAVALFSWRRRVPLGSLSDIVAVSTPFGLFFGRLANFINDELWGRVTTVPWAFVFPKGGPEPRHPSQLYEAALEGVVLFLVLRLLTHRFGMLRRPWFATGAFVAGYGLARTTAEFFRMPDAHIGFFAGWLTMGMLLSVPMILVGAALMAWAARRPAPVPVDRVP
jgi:phosphatidylglycerol:prolipoprotein diacylglycerol transferase